MSLSHEEICIALAHGWRGAQWSLSGADWSGAEWHGPGSKPTIGQLEATYAEASQAAILTTYRDAIEAHVDAVARERDYSGAVSVATYVGSTNSAWAAEAQAFVQWRDAVWAYAFQELEKVKNAQRDAPSIADFLAELPTINWPE